jgi:arylsulfatase A-like enzyme
MKRNVALIVIDTLRKDYFDKYSTNLEEQSDTSFEQCRAASSWSSPSHASILTGSLPHEHGVHTENHDFSEIDISDTFLNELYNYSTIGITQHNLFGPENDFDKYFDEYLQPATVSNDINPSRNGMRRYADFLIKCLNSDYPIQNLDDLLWLKFDSIMSRLPIPKLTDDGASTLAKTAIEKVQSHSEPLFLFMNFFDVHHPYRTNRNYKSNYSVPNSWNAGKPTVWEYNERNRADEQYTKNYRSMYRASVEYVDKVISDMVSKINKTTEKETTFIITSDHGHNLGYEADNYLFGHDSTLTEGVVHTPLEIINTPTGWPATEGRFFSHCNLGDIILDLAEENELSDELFPKYVCSEVVGRPSGYADLPRFPGSEDEFEYWNRMARCVYDGDKKYQWDSEGTEQLYQIDYERPSYQRLITDNPEIPSYCYDEFKTCIEAYKRSVVQEGADETTKQRLKNLGYL